MKTCKRCGCEKPLSAFYKQASAKDGHQAWCKFCYRDRDREVYRADPKAAHAKMKGWRERKKAADPEAWNRYKRDMHFRGKYGISLDGWETLYDAQLGRCAICHIAFGEVQPCVDHSHQTGEVRGLLCHWCNTGLGGFRDNPLNLQRALQYLDSYDREPPTERAQQGSGQGEGVMPSNGD